MKYNPFTAIFWYKVFKRIAHLPFLKWRYRKSLSRILENEGEKRVVIFMPTVDWGWMVQRPHQLARQFARKGYLCFFVTAQTRADRVDGFKQVEPSLYLCSDSSLLYGIPRPLLVLSNLDSSREIERFRRPFVLYDFLDTLEVTAGEITERRLAEHRAMLGSAHLLVATAQNLFEEARELREDVELVPNAVDPEHFQRACQLPEDLAPIRQKGRPIIGYYGAMAEWFDYDLIARAAAELEAEFVFLGPDYDGSVKKLVRRDNVHYLGLKPYAALPDYLHYFDVAIIPFQINSITKATSPVKLFEYMAGGKPIVTTPMDEVLRYRSVLVGEGDGFVARLREALSLRQNPEYLALLTEEAEQNTWSRRVDHLIERWEAKERESLPAVVLLAGVPIDDSGGGQRPAQLALECLRRGFRVIYLNKYPKQEEKDLSLRIVHPNLETVELTSFDPELYLGHEKSLLAIAEMPHPDFLPAIRAIRARGGRIAYDLIDDWQTSLGGTWYRLEHEMEVIRESEILVASAQELVEDLEERSGRSVTLAPNAVNLSLFQLRTYERPLDLPQGDRLILYIGALWGEWFDWDLVLRTAVEYPDAQVVLIGDYHGQCSNPLPNMQFLGLKPQSELPAYLFHADVAIIPFKVSKLTQAVSPLKVFEYLAMAKPVVSTSLRELEGLPYVFLAENQETFVRMIREAWSTPIEAETIQRFRDANSWKNRVDAILGVVRVP